MGGDPATETLHQENIPEWASSSKTQNLTSGYILPVSHNCNSVGRAEKVVKRGPSGLYGWVTCGRCDSFGKMVMFF